jgi:hypothetical protein
MIAPCWSALSAPNDRWRHEVDAFAPPTREATAVPQLPTLVGPASSFSSEGNGIPRALGTRTGRIDALRPATPLIQHPYRASTCAAAQSNAIFFPPAAEMLFVDGSQSVAAAGQETLRIIG